MRSTQKFLYLIAGLALLGGISFLYSQRDFLMGSFTGVESTSIEDAATLAEAESQSAQGASISAAIDAIVAGNTYTANDTSGLAEAQNYATLDADSAKQSAENATEYANQAQAFYDEIYTAWETSYEEYETSESSYQLAHDFYQAAVYEADSANGEWEYGKIEAYISQTSSDCNSAANTSSEITACANRRGDNLDLSEDFKNTFDACLATNPYNADITIDPSTVCINSYIDSAENEWSTLNTINLDPSIEANHNLAALEADYDTKAANATTFLRLYEEAEATYITAFYDTLELRETLDAAEPYLNAAFASANSALDYANQALSSKNLANSYQFLSCTGLTLSPGSYEMALTDSSAAFNLTAILSTEESSNTSWFSSRNLLAFALEELETVVRVTGTVEAGIYHPETYETQSKWLGLLTFETSGYGNFSDGSSIANPFEIEKVDSSDSTLSFSGGTENDLITVTAEDEQGICSNSFTISRESAEVEDEALPPPSPEVSISQSSPDTSVIEGGTVDSFIVLLLTEPSADVTLIINTDDQILTSPSTLIFPTSSWSDAQTVTVSAVDDTVVEGDHNGGLAFAVSSADPDYSGLAVPGLTVNITDNDVAEPVFAISISQSSPDTSVTEGGGLQTPSPCSCSTNPLPTLPLHSLQTIKSLYPQTLSHSHPVTGPALKR